MITLDASDIRFIQYHIKEYGGINDAIEVCLKELDATFILPDNTRPRQTNSYVWKRTDAEFHYLMNMAMDDGMTNEQYDVIISRYNNIIKSNIAFEKENPTVIYDKKGRNVSKKVRVDKVKSMFNDDTLAVGETAVKSKTKPKKETVAERKAKILNSKAISFAFGGFKPKE